MSREARVVRYHADALDVIPTLADESVDAVVTDPPYELGFMGRAWDASGIAYNVELWKQCFRVLKPGGHLLAFGGTRTSHRLAVAVEDAGFEIRDSIVWIYGSGFPKSLRVNSDPRFCQCAARTDASARSDADTTPAPDEDDRTSTAAPSASRSAGAPVPSARHESGQPRGSRAGYRSDRGSGDALLPLGPVAGPSLARQPLDVQTRTRSSAPDDYLAGPGPSRSPVLSDTDRPATTGSHFPSAFVGTRFDNLPSRTPDLHGTGSASGLQATGNGYKGESRASAFPQCSACGKPNADGFGTALKPAHEPIVVARKPLIGTVAANVLAHGTGALNIDACRVNPGEAIGGGGGWAAHKVEATAGWDRPYVGGVAKTTGHDAGRWPPNVVLDEGAAAELDEQSGTLTSGGGDRGSTSRTAGIMGQPSDRGRHTAYARPSDIGGASRFFPVFRYQAKAPTRERPKVNGVAHTTVKPLELMRWLVRLVTQPDGVVLEPFAGSGTTVEACILEGMRCLAIEREESYLPLIAQRIERAGLVAW